MKTTKLNGKKKGEKSNGFTKYKVSKLKDVYESIYRKSSEEE